MPGFLQWRIWHRYVRGHNRETGRHNMMNSMRNCTSISPAVACVGLWVTFLCLVLWCLITRVDACRHGHSQGKNSSLVTKEPFMLPL